MKKAVVFLLVFLMGAALFAQQKHALIIGNGDYTGVSKLNNTVNDADDMEAALKGLNFTSVTKVLDGDLNRMLTEVTNLKRKLSASSDSYGFFFYSGHGVQSNGENYLIPVNASNIQSENLLRQLAVSLQFVLDELGDAGNALNMIVLDACRDNPFSWNRGGSRGLSVLGRAPSGSIVMYATSANSTASDGTGRNGVFTGQFLNNLKTPGLSVFQVFDNTMNDVIKVSGGRQHPELSLRFPGSANAYLGSRPVASVAVQPAPAVIQPTPTPQPAPAVIQPTSSSIAANMVRINGGTFTMGSPASEPERNSNEGPQHQVTVSPFYIGKYEVTQAEYESVTGANFSEFKGINLPVEMVSWFDAVEYCNKLSQREGLTPAYSISVSMNSGFVTWNRGANGYRLPTEAEWEYACRAGTTTPFSTGNNITTNQANYNGNFPYNNNAKGAYLGKKTAVGSFGPNPWGLYDMHSNVSEWCWDWNGTYSDAAQTDPVGAPSGFDRVWRGGNVDHFAKFLRSASRIGNTPSYRGTNLGFRLARNAN